ncbi:hypothetical protein NVP1064O_22 [Vibrio phage 1.064.O._10N.261.52.E2]|nr:hypothetical protein NVP1064O_22 [Vibrio phage 1.064.O._10N.261.52.E2]AUR88088.1 hypothetical protein NVP1108O_22 [Vibrio phage 1.108.O._10N.222.51.A4]
MSCSDFPTIQTAKTFKLDAETQNEVVTSDNDRTNPASDGKTKLTLKGFENQVETLIEEGSQEITDAIENTIGKSYIGTWTQGVTTFTTMNEYSDFNGITYKPKSGATLPYTAQTGDPTTAPDNANVVPFSDVNSSNIGTLTSYRSANVIDMISGVPIGAAVNVDHYIDQVWFTGGTQWRVISTPVSDITDFEPLNEIYLSDLGVINDGVTDNSISLNMLRTLLISDSEKDWRVVGSGGVVCYSDNKWLVDVKKISFDGMGCELKNISTSPSSNEARPLFIQRVFEGDIFNNTFDVHDGILIQDAIAGDGKVITSTPSDAARISEGEWALVYGYDQQQFSGYLPNARFFDWVLVENVEQSTGEISFSGGNRLRNSYFNSWADGESGGVAIGKPRIISTVRTISQGYSANRVFPLNHNFKNVKFNSESPVGVSWGHSSVFLDMSSITIRNAGTFYTALGSKLCKYDNITFDQGPQKPLTEFAIEQDKLTELCVVKNTLPGHGLAGGTGVDNIVFENMSFPKDCRVRVGAKQVTFNQCELLGCRSVSQPEYLLQYSDAAVESIRFNNCRMILNDDQLGISAPQSGSTIITSSEWSSLGDREISITGDAITGEYSSKLSVGTMLVIGEALTDGSGETGVIQSIRTSGSDTIVALRGTVSGSFDDTQDIRIYNSNAPTFNDGCSIKKRDGSIVNQPLTATTPAFLYGACGVKTISYSTLQMSDFVYGEIGFPCIIKEIRVEIVKPYTGASSEFFIEIARIEQASQRVQIDLKASGYRRLNSFEKTNQQTGDSVIQNLFDSPNLRGIKVFNRNDSGGGNPSDTFDSGVMPIYNVEIDLTPIIV